MNTQCILNKSAMLYMLSTILLYNASTSHCNHSLPFLFKYSLVIMRQLPIIKFINYSKIKYYFNPFNASVMQKSNNFKKFIYCLKLCSERVNLTPFLEF